MLHRQPPQVSESPDGLGRSGQVPAAEHGFIAERGLGVPDPVEVRLVLECGLCGVLQKFQLRRQPLGHPAANAPQRPEPL